MPQNPRFFSVSKIVDHFAWLRCEFKKDHVHRIAAALAKVSFPLSVPVSQILLHVLEHLSHGFQ